MFFIQQLLHQTNVVDLFRYSDNVDHLICIRPANCDWALRKSSAKRTDDFVNAIYALSNSLDVCLPSYIDYISEDDGNQYLDSFKFKIKDIRGREIFLCRIVLSGEELLVSSRNELQQFCLFNINLIMSK